MTDDSISREATTNIPVVDEIIIIMRREMEGIKKDPSWTSRNEKYNIWNKNMNWIGLRTD